jgi:hypothetical protein
MARATGRHEGRPLRGGPLMAGIILATFAGDPGIRADEIRMHNGDRLTGRVIRQDGGVLTLQTDYAETLDIAWAEVREVKLGEPIDMVMSDDRLLTVTEIARDADRLRVQPIPPVTQSMEVDPERVQVIAPEDWEIGRGYRLGGELNASLTSDRGNSHTDDVYIDYRLDYRRQCSRLESYGQLEYETSRGQKLTDNWLVFNKYIYELTEPWYASGWLQFNKDRFADLRLRTLIGPAIGYRFFEREDLTLSAEIGAIHIDEQFYDSADQALTTDTTLLLKLGYQWQ